jgi:hypothetical protein
MKQPVVTIVGQAILPAAAFQAALLSEPRILTFGKRRLKAGGSQDWLPHVLPGLIRMAGSTVMVGSG